jgi:hypothetical protein
VASNDAFWLSGGHGETTIINFGQPDEVAIDAPGLFNAYVAKYDLNGSLILARHLFAAVSEAGAVKLLDLNSLLDESLLILGRYNKTMSFSTKYLGETLLTAQNEWDLFIAKADSEGNLEWVKDYGYAGPGYQADEQISAFEDGSFVISRCGEDGLEYDTGEVVKLTEDGEIEWEVPMPAIYGIVALDDGTPLVSGWFREPSYTFGPGEPNETTLAARGNVDAFVARLAEDGSLMWANRAGGDGADKSYVIGGFTDGSSIICGMSDSPIIYYGADESITTVPPPNAYISLFMAKFGP